MYVPPSAGWCVGAATLLSACSGRLYASPLNTHAAGDPLATKLTSVKIRCLEQECFAESQLPPAELHLLEHVVQLLLPPDLRRRRELLHVSAHGSTSTTSCLHFARPAWSVQMAAVLAEPLRSSIGPPPAPPTPGTVTCAW